MAFQMMILGVFFRRIDNWKKHPLVDFGCRKWDFVDKDQFSGRVSKISGFFVFFSSLLLSFWY